VKRREFITLLGGAAAWPLAVRAQQQSKPPTIGFMGSTTAAAWTPYVAAFEERLRELGWAQGRTIAIDYRWGEGRSERFAEIAAQFVRRRVDVIVTSGTAAAAAMQATSVIPIVLAVANDPVGSGMVASLARPGGNVTGLSLQAPDLAGKRLELLREVRPGLRAVAIMASTYPAAVSEMDDVAAAARTLGLETRLLKVRRADDIPAAMATLAGGRAGALCVCRRDVEHQPRSHHRVGAGRASRHDVRLQRICRSGKLDVLWAQLSRLVPARRRLRQQDPARRKTG
jgi:putative ABC transport system substrate-binding protein